MKAPVHYVRNTEVDAASARFARALDEAGVPPRGRVACLTANTPETLAAYQRNHLVGQALHAHVEPMDGGRGRLCGRQL